MCRRCGVQWPRPPQGFSTTPSSRSPKRSGRQMPLTPPPGLGQKPHKMTKIQKATAEALGPGWTTLDSALQQRLQDLGIQPPPPSPGPDLKDVLLENMAQLPPQVKELVEKLTKPSPPTEQDVTSKLKTQVSLIKDLSHKKSNLQTKIDATKRSYQELLEEMKAIQGKIEAEQQALTATSASYMTLVNSAKPDFAGLPEADAGDPVPAAVAGFINTLGVNLTEEQQDQLQSMLKRPTTQDSSR